MSTNTQNEQDQEIDLTQVFKKIGGFFDSIAMAIFKGILFIKKNILIFISLFIIGAGLGYFLDSTSKKYNNEIIVSPNMGGTDFLYSKIDLLSSKLKEEDISYLKKIGITNPDKINSIKVEPVIDIYSFVNQNNANAANAQNTQNFELVKLLSEDGDINKVIKDELTSKNYSNHKIKIETSGKISNDEVIKPILKFLNTDVYYNKILQISRDNTIIKMKKNEQEIAQVDSILKYMATNLRQSKNQNLIYNNENNQINPLFDLKNGLINEIAAQKISLENLKVFIKDSSITINVINAKGINSKMKLILPILFIGLFLLFSVLKSFYNNQKSKLA